jgi:glycerol-3-phosphate acyltransferase PlsY
VSAALGLAAAALAGFLLGAIPFGLLLGFAAGKGDLRRVGSGNIGATNALRAGGPVLGLATLLLDAGKGFAAVWLGHSLAGPDGALLGGLAAFLGHLFSPFLGFRGGKGVATMLGVAVALAPHTGLAFAAVWIAAVALTRISSAGGLAASAAAPVAAWALGEPWAALALAAMAALVWWRHRANIERLRAGTEPRLGGIRRR